MLKRLLADAVWAERTRADGFREVIEQQKSTMMQLQECLVLSERQSEDKRASTQNSCVTEMELQERALMNDNWSAEETQITQQSPELTSSFEQRCRETVMNVTLEKIVAEKQAQIDELTQMMHIGKLSCTSNVKTDPQQWKIIESRQAEIENLQRLLKESISAAGCDCPPLSENA